jgi:hypothetical protein
MGYYEWRGRAPSHRAIRHGWLTDLIRHVHAESRLDRRRCSSLSWRGRRPGLQPRRRPMPAVEFSSTSEANIAAQILASTSALAASKDTGLMTFGGDVCFDRALVLTQIVRPHLPLFRWRPRRR